VISSRAAPADLRIVLFSGGRGSGALAELIATDPGISLTVAINGYDDGASTGEVRRFLGDALGPSDFRKNASRLARLRNTCAPALIELLDSRLPDRADVEHIRQLTTDLERGAGATAGIDPAARTRAAAWLRAFDAEYRRGGELDFNGAAVGNFVFAGAFLEVHRRFNDAVDAYCALVGLPPGLVENVTDGNNAFLVRMTMNELEQKLDPQQFARIHRSTIVNIARVKEVTPDWHGEFDVKLLDGTNLRLTRTYRNRLLP